MKKKILFIILLTITILIKTGMGFDYQALIDSQSIPTESVLDFRPDIAVTVSAYSPTEEECDDDPYITAYQRTVKEGTIAISRDLEEEFGWSLGDKVHLKGIGVFVVWDRMNPRWKKKVDIFFHDTEKAVSFGIKQARVLKVEKKEKRGV